MYPYRHIVALYDRFNTIITAIGSLAALIGAMLSGIYYHWILSLVMIAAYFIIGMGLYYGLKYLTNKYLRQAHFALAIYCRAVNNSFYLPRSLEIRPGYLAKWIEFLIHRIDAKDDPSLALLHKL